MQQSALFNQFDQTQSTWGTAMAPCANAPLPSLRCPTSPLPLTNTFTPNGNGPYDNVAWVSYVGISGATTDAFAGSAHVETRQTDGANNTGCCTGGRISGGGVLPANQAIKVSDIPDGTSNTLLVSEQSDYLTQLDGTKVTWSTGWHGWLIGTSQRGVAGGSNFSNADHRIFGLVSVRYQINRKTGWANGGDCGGTGVCPNFGCNVPLNSAHPNGVNAAFADGSVRFLANSTPLLTLAALSTRDEGITVAVP